MAVRFHTLMNEIFSVLDQCHTSVHFVRVIHSGIFEGIKFVLPLLSMMCIMRTIYLSCVVLKAGKQRWLSARLWFHCFTINTTGMRIDSMCAECQRCMVVLTERMWACAQRYAGLLCSCCCCYLKVQIAAPSLVSWLLTDS